MVRADVQAIAPQNALENRDDFLGAGSWFPVGRPELPGVQIHQAFRVERRCVEVVGVLTHHGPHRVLVLHGQRFQVGLGIV